MISRNSSTRISGCADRDAAVWPVRRRPFDELAEVPQRKMCCKNNPRRLCQHQIRTKDPGAAVLILGARLLLNLVSRFTFICHPGKTHNHRSRGDTPWRAQTWFFLTSSFFPYKSQTRTFVPTPVHRADQLNFHRPSIQCFHGRSYM